MSPGKPTSGRGQGIAREAILAGVRLLGRSPLAFLAWVLLRMGSLYVPLAILLGARQLGAAPMVGSAWAILAALPFEAILTAAVLRAALKPGASAFAFVRLGTVEFRMAGLLILAGMVGVLIALLALTGVAYLAISLREPSLAKSASGIGLMAAGLALTRFAPAAAILVDRAKVDLGAAWRASRGRYWLLAIVILVAVVVDRGLGEVGAQLIAPAGARVWPDLFAPLLLGSVFWRSIVSVVGLALISGAVATVWRASKQTLD